MHFPSLPKLQQPLSAKIFAPKAKIVCMEGGKLAGIIASLSPIVVDSVWIQSFNADSHQTAYRALGAGCLWLSRNSKLQPDSQSLAPATWKFASGISAFFLLLLLFRVPNSRFIDVLCCACAPPWYAQKTHSMVAVFVVVEWYGFVWASRYKYWYTRTTVISKCQ